MSYIQGYWTTYIGKKVKATQTNGIAAEGLLLKVTDNDEDVLLQKIDIQTSIKSEKVGKVKPENKFKTAVIYAVNIKSLEVV